MRMCPVRLKCCLQISCTEQILWIISILFVFPPSWTSMSFQTLPTLTCRSEQSEGEEADPRLLGLSSPQFPVIQPKETAQHCLLLGNPVCQTLWPTTAIIHHPPMLPPEREKKPRRDPDIQLRAPELRLTCETTLTLCHPGRWGICSLNPGLPGVHQRLLPLRCAIPCWAQAIWTETSSQLWYGCLWALKALDAPSKSPHATKMTYFPHSSAFRSLVNRLHSAYFWLGKCMLFPTVDFF